VWAVALTFHSAHYDHLALLVFYLYGFTLNRITLFALIFSIGILVDDAIVVVENIVRHFHLPQNKDRSRTRPA
jgi:multidrug efflux pump subunit AcrB